MKLNRWTLAVFLLFIMLVPACGSTAGVRAFAPTKDTSLEAGEHRFTEFSIPEGVDVELGGDALVYVEGPIQIDGTISGDCARLEIHGAEGLALTGLIDNRCSDEAANADVWLVATGDITLGDSVSEEPVILSGGSVTIAVPEEVDSFMGGSWPDGGALASAGRGGHGLAAPVRQEKQTVIIDQSVLPGPSGDFNIYASTGGRTMVDVNVNVSLTAPSGWDARPLEQSGTCDASERAGRPGGKIVLMVETGTVRIAEGVVLKAGDGGKGGECRAWEGCPATAVGGGGGLGGNIEIYALNFEASPYAEFQPGNGGPGGGAVAIGDDGKQDCEAGCAGRATGGPGGHAGYLIFEVDFGPGRDADTFPSEFGGNGGTGGAAHAIGGNGAPCFDCPAGAGGTGGDAEAIGGKGGAGGIGFSGEDANLGGNGGEAIADSGHGGYGANCCDSLQEGGDGGDGGTATATGGAAGEGTMGDGATGRSRTNGVGWGGFGGDGFPGGYGGYGGQGRGTPDPIMDGPPGDFGNLCKLQRVWLALMRANVLHEPQKGYSWIRFYVKLLLGDPEPAPGATVTATMIGPDSSSETLSAQTDADGAAELSFQIFVYGSYSLSVDDVELDGYVYDPTVNIADTLVVDVGPAEGPIGYGDDAVRAFYASFNQAIETGDRSFLFESLHPAVLDQYGTAACQSYLETVVQSPAQVEVLAVTDFGSFTWEQDGISTTIEHAYSIDAIVTTEEKSVETTVHLAPLEDGRLGWFTDCGDPVD